MSVLLQELLGREFDRRSMPLVVVSTFDRTITYANPAVVNPRDEPNVSGLSLVNQSVDDVASRWGIDVKDTVLETALQNPQDSDTVYTQPSPFNQGNWWCVSILPTSSKSREAILSSHVERDQACRLHRLLCRRTALAFELAEGRQMQAGALQMLAESDRRLSHAMSLWLQVIDEFPVEG